MTLTHQYHPSVFLVDIVVGSMSDIEQLSFLQGIFVVLLYICDIVVDQCHQPQCHPSVTMFEGYLLKKNRKENN
jgi:hypothetical protein